MSKILLRHLIIYTKFKKNSKYALKFFIPKSESSRVLQAGANLSLSGGALYLVNLRGFFFYFYHRKIAKRGGGWLLSGATISCYPQGMLDLSCRRLSRKEKMCRGMVAPGLKPPLFQIRYEDISLRYYDNPERSCAGVYTIETHA